MGDYKKIFLIMDPSRRQTPAFRRAVRIARASGATLHLGLHEHPPALGVMGLVDRRVAEEARRAFLQERESALDEMARKLTEEGVTTSSDVELSTPVADAIAERVYELAPDLVIKDVHHEPALSRLWFTPLDWQLLRLCPAPLLLVGARNDEWPRRIVAAVDTLDVAEPDASLNDRIVREALRVALEFNGEVHLVHTFEGLPAAMGGMAEGVDAVALAWQQLSDLDRERFEAFARRYGVTDERKHLLAGPAAHMVAKFARDSNADLVVLGTVYRTGLERLLMGSTAELLLNLVHCDVLAVQPEGFRADLMRHLGLKPPAPILQAA